MVTDVAMSSCFYPASIPEAEKLKVQTLLRLAAWPAAGQACIDLSASTGLLFSCMGLGTLPSMQPNALIPMRRSLYKRTGSSACFQACILPTSPLWRRRGGPAICKGGAVCARLFRALRRPHEGGSGKPPARWDAPCLTGCSAGLEHAPGSS